jgi:hypothetical protein
VRCDAAAPHLPGVIDGTHTLPPEVAAHVASCLRCQVESLRYRRVARSMRQLRDHSVVPGPDLVLDILAWIEEAESSGVRASRLRRAAYVAAAATAATAAGAAGALVIANRSRRGRLDLAG